MDLAIHADDNTAIFAPLRGENFLCCRDFKLLWT